MLFVLMLKFLFLEIDNELQFHFLHFFSNLDHKFFCSGIDLSKVANSEDFILMQKFVQI
jgi:hypothetical protein